MSKKKKSCILHFGTAKTGTTALQFGLANYDDGETVYARFPTSPDNPNHSEPLVVAGFGEAGIRECVNNFPRWNASADKLRWPNSIPMKMMQRQNHAPDASAYQAALDATIATVSHDRVIYSGEGLFSNYGCAAGLIAKLRQSFENVQGVCYLRACPGAFLSRFQQRLTASHPAMFFSGSLREDLNLLIYNDARYLKHWKHALEEEGLITAIYAPQDMTNGDIVDDFCSRLGLDPARARRIRRRCLRFPIVAAPRRPRRQQYRTDRRHSERSSSSVAGRRVSSACQKRRPRWLDRPPRVFGNAA